jgi:hypothetical protein
MLRGKIRRWKPSRGRVHEVQIQLTKTRRQGRDHRGRRKRGGGGGKEFIFEGFDKGCDVSGVELVQIPEFMKVDFVGTLTAKSRIDRRGDAVLGGNGSCGGISVTPFDSKVARAL